MADTNLHFGEIAFPSAGKGALVCVDVDALDKLESEYGPDYLETVMDGMNKGRVSIYRKIFSVALRGADEDKAFPFGKSLTDLQLILLDAMYATLYGKTLKQKQEEDEADRKKQMREAAEELAENPHIAAMTQLLSQVSPEKTVTEQG